LIEVPAYIAICSLLISRLGLTGAALACTFRVSFDAILMYWAAHKYCFLRLKSLTDIGRVLTIGLILTAAMVSVRMFLHNTWEHLLPGVGLLFVWYIAAWIHGLKGDDRPPFGRTLRLAMQKEH